MAKEIDLEALREAVRIDQQLVKHKWLGSLYDFNTQCLQIEQGKDRVKLNKFHKELCDFVDKNPQNQKLILVPRGHLKSSLVTIGKCLQWIAKDPSVRILIANATYQMAITFLNVIKRHLQTNSEFIEIFGELAKNPERWSENIVTLESAKVAGGEKEATVCCYGMGGNLVSQHYDKIILDDIVNEDTVNTREQIDKTIQFYRMCQPLLEKNGEMIIIGTRYHEQDLYGWIMDKENGVSNDFDVFERVAITNELWDENSREYIRGNLLWPEKYDLKEISKIRRKTGPWVFSCTPEETPILMADFTEKPISEIKVGDKVVGFKRGVGTGKNKLVKATVKNVFKKQDDVYDLKMESGRFVRCTKDHRWYTGRKDASHKMYMPPKRGKKLMFVCPTNYRMSKRILQKNKDWENRYWSYLGGMFDADGCAKSSGLSITQGIGNKGVCSMIRRTLKGLRIPFSEFYRDNQSKNNNWKDTILFYLKDKFNTSVRFIRNSDFAKKYQVIKKLYEQGSIFIKEKDKITRMERSKFEDVYALETTTGNYVAWGYASSNSQYLNDPVPPDTADFKRDWFKYFEESDLKGLDLNKYTLIDPAISLETQADFTAMVTIGIDRYSNIYILDIVRDHFPVDGIINAIFYQYERWHPQAIGVEDVAFQRALRYSLSQEMQKRKKFMNIIELKPNARSKDQRIKGLQPQYANGKVLHNRNLVYNIYLEDELLRFPRGKHDDIIDALAYALDVIHPPVPRVSRQRNHKYLYG